MKILVAEDNAVLRMIHQEQLTAWGILIWLLMVRRLSIMPGKMVRVMISA